ncbi:MULTISPECIES: C40 family peptidase [Citrobacter]|uniref:C40 family peptidase n=1 Tax=Citrobacter TaxID=544 RepID=UPI00200AA4F6|nr:MULTISPECIES: C40 family peptidase [Citrobacter]MDM3017151.1 C40 family peptidase [Citrobacter sp. CK189]
MGWDTRSAGNWAKHHAEPGSAGFRKISSTQSPRAGDVVVIQPYAGGHAAGHMAIYDGQDWYSDFKQRDFWGGPGYRSSKPAHQMYRKD